MKRYLSILLMAICSFVAYADDVDMGDNNNDDPTRPNKAPYVMPHVSYDRGILSISTHYFIYNVEIVIRDSRGTVIYTVTDTLSEQYAVRLPDFVIADMYIIELIYAGHHLIGYF